MVKCKIMNKINERKLKHYLMKFKTAQFNDKQKGSNRGLI